MEQKRLHREMGSTGGWEMSRRAPRLSTNRFHHSSSLCRMRPRRNAGEGSSLLPFSFNLLWQMLQLHLCPGVEVCWRRSRRWADKITEAKAVRE